MNTTSTALCFCPVPHLLVYDLGRNSLKVYIAILWLDLKFGYVKIRSTILLPASSKRLSKTAKNPRGWETSDQSKLSLLADCTKTVLDDRHLLSQAQESRKTFYAFGSISKVRSNHLRTRRSAGLVTWLDFYKERQHGWLMPAMNSDEVLSSKDGMFLLKPQKSVEWDKGTILIKISGSSETLQHLAK